MPKWTLIPLILIFMTPTVCGRLSMFDGHREGFIASASAGPGITWISSQNGDLSGTFTAGTIVQMYRFGYAPNSQLQFYYTHRQSSLASDVWNVYEDWADKAKNKTIGYIAFFLFIPVIAIFSDQHILIGLGTTAYVRPSIPSWFFEAGFGISDVGDPYDSDRASAFPKGVGSGLGLFGGAGYEFNRHGRAELQFMWAQSSNDKPGMVRNWTASSLMLVVTIMGY